MKTISIAIIGIAIGMIVMLSSQSKTETFGNTTLPVGGTTYNLAGSGVSASASSITLASLTIPQTGQKLQDSDFSDTFYITIDPGSRTKQEFVSCTTVTQNASSATLSGCSRGLSPISPYTASSSLQFAHAGGAQVIFSNPPQLYNQFAAKGNDEAVTGAWTFAYANPPAFTYNLPDSTWTSEASSTIATKGYVDAVSIAGASDATTLAKGIVEIATQTEAASSTSLGGTGATIVLPASMATDTPSTGTRTGRVLMSDLNGYLTQTWLNLTAQWNFTSLFATSASTTYATSTNMWFTGITSSILKVDSAGKVSAATLGTDYTKPSYSYASTSNTTATGSNYATTSAALTIPASTLSASSTMDFRFTATCADGASSGASCTIYLRDNATGKTLATCTITSSNGQTAAFGGSTLTTATTTSAQATTGFVTALNLYYPSPASVGTAGSTCNGFSTVDWTSAFSPVVTVKGGTSITATLTSYSIRVNP